MLAKRLVVPVLVFVLSSLCRAAVPSLDPSFGTAGTAILTSGELGGLVTSLAIQPDGKPVIGYGNLIPVGRFLGTEGFLGRLTVTGSVDTSLFGGSIREYEVPKVRVQRDNKILILNRHILARYLPDGTLDVPYTFNAASATNLFDPGFEFMDFALQADRKVVIAGEVGTTNGVGQGSRAVEIVRFNTDGTLDTSFGVAGHTRIPVLTGFDVVVGIIALPLGRIAVAINRFAPGTPAALLQLDASGILDSTFGDSGSASADVVADALAAQSDGRTLLVTRARGTTGSLVRVTRFTNAGTVDLGFGTLGTVTQPAALNLRAYSVHIVVQADDKFILTTSQPVQVTRYRSDGSLDKTFGDGGILSPAWLRSIEAIALDHDGSLWAAGESTQPAPRADISGRGNPAVAHYIGGTTAAIEFYNSALDHYLITTNPHEAAALDLGAFQGWTRTGQSFNVVPTSAGELVGTVPICRFYIPPPFGDSHFFAASQAECGDVASRFPQFVLETMNALRVGLPDAVSGSCSSPTPVSVYRAWNARADTNHRYTTSRVTRDSMVAKGWVAEGYGPDAVAMCASSQ